MRNIASCLLGPSDHVWVCIASCCVYTTAEREPYLSVQVTHLNCSVQDDSHEYVIFQDAESVAHPLLQKQCR